MSPKRLVCYPLTFLRYFLPYAISKKLKMLHNTHNTAPPITCIGSCPFVDRVLFCQPNEGLKITTYGLGFLGKSQNLLSHSPSCQVLQSLLSLTVISSEHVILSCALKRLLFLGLVLFYMWGIYNKELSKKHVLKNRIMSISVWRLATKINRGRFIKCASVVSKIFACG